VCNSDAFQNSILCIELQGSANDFFEANRSAKSLPITPKPDFSSPNGFDSRRVAVDSPKAKKLLGINNVAPLALPQRSSSLSSTMKRSTSPSPSPKPLVSEGPSSLAGSDDIGLSASYSSLSSSSSSSGATSPRGIMKIHQMISERDKTILTLATGLQAALDGTERVQEQISTAVAELKRNGDELMKLDAKVSSIESLLRSLATAILPSQ
jgi:hypothetical protein